MTSTQLPACHPIDPEEKSLNSCRNLNCLGFFKPAKYV